MHAAGFICQLVHLATFSQCPLLPVALQLASSTLAQAVLSSPIHSQLPSPQQQQRPGNSVHSPGTSTAQRVNVFAQQAITPAQGAQQQMPPPNLMLSSQANANMQSMQGSHAQQQHAVDLREMLRHLCVS